jgi:phosphatidylserine/phosphatidylglycerophosphate/cardiolipin synthase-like enzyme
MTEARAIEPGRTAWRTAHAERVAFLVDADDYFSAFVDAVSRARRSVMILAWDIDSRLRLIRDAAPDDADRDLATVLSDVLDRRPELEVRILCWDFSPIYAMERELLSRFKMDWGTHPRLHFNYDDHHPAAGSLHEKIVVIDDRVAFIGGIDLGPRRWDTSDHLPDDRRRTSPTGHDYRPFHDIQAVVEGDIARVLSELARERWDRATDERVDPPQEHGEPWPDGVDAAVEDLEIAVVRTRPAAAGGGEMRHTQRFHERIFELAEHRIYAENQFLTSDAISDALARTIGREDPPEVLLVTAKENSGWLETAIMGGLRARFCRRLRQADRSGRLEIMYPEVGGGTWPNVHSKLTIVDDRWAYLGSANFANRSMGLDTECGLGFDGTGRDDVRAALRALRIRLLSEHLGVEPEEFAESEHQHGLLGAVRVVAGGDRSLHRLEIDEPELGQMLEPVAKIADPDHPLRLGELLDDVL